MRLPRDFYASDTIDVARDLLGKELVHSRPDGVVLSGIIVETEAYLGVEDPAAHSFGGRRTARTEVMFGDPGFSYVYFIYGMHFCFNVITAERDNPEAVLVRAIQPLRGYKEMQARFPHLRREHLANGPGKLCRALQIERSHNKMDLTESASLWIEEASSAVDVVEGPRVGIGDRHDAVFWPLRFGIKDHPALSPARFPSELILGTGN